MNFDELYVDTVSSASKLAAIGDTENLKKLVDLGKPTNGQDNKGWRALHHACHGGHIECTEILLKAADVDINAITFMKETALKIVCCSELDQELKVKVAEILLEAGADPNHENQDQFETILNHVVASGNLPLAKLLLKFKVNVKERDHKNGTALKAAVKSESLEMVKLITDQCVNFGGNAQPRHYLRAYKDEESANFLQLAVLQENTDILQHLVKNPYCVSEINIAGDLGKTPLSIAAMKPYREGIKILLDHGADPNIKDKNDILPLMHLAEQLEDEDIATPESLFGRMAKLTNKRDFKRPRYCGCSFFHRLPFYKKSNEIFSYLMEHFPDINPRGVYAPVDYSISIPMKHDTLKKQKFAFSALAYCCDQIEKHKNYNLFETYVKYDSSNINDCSNHKIPPIIVALGNKNQDLRVIEHLIKNGADILIQVEERFVYSYPSTMRCLFQTPNPSPALELLFAIFAPPEYLFTGFQEIIDTFSSQSQRYEEYIFSTHRDTVTPMSFLLVSCSVAKYMNSSFLKEREVEDAAEMINDNYDDGYNDGYSVEDGEEFDEFLRILRTPKSLQRLASVCVRDTVYKHRKRHNLPLCHIVEDLCREMKLPEVVKDQLLFR